MGIQLYEHNQTAYDSALALLARTGRAAVIHPTGTGKSLIGFKLCEDHPDKSVCWLSPSEYIFRTQIENLENMPGVSRPSNISFYTYAKLMLMDEAEIRAIKPDYLILDEFHRCGAPYWGASVQRLLELYPGVPVLGLSATNIRYLDNQRDMAQELFGGNIASEMTLGEAIVRGILMPPKYVMSVYSYQKDIERCRKRAGQIRNQARRQQAEEYLEALRRALEKAEGLDEVFDRHMADRTGKYIVFCANKEHMDTMMEKAPEWFARVDRTPHIYSVYSEDPLAAQAFEDFKADRDNSRLRLLFCIDALNEGIHLEEVSGVVLLRPTVSPIIYKQQIGRALCAGGKKEPVVFDIVNNIAGLYSIASIEEEMEEAVQYYQFLGKSGYIVNESFRVIDELRDCRRLFEAFESTLSASWDFMYREAERYYARNGDILPPQAYVTENGSRLGQWVTAQRAAYRSGNGISPEQVRKLEAVGMRWQTLYERQWEEGYALAKSWQEAHGNLSIPHGENPRLAGWLARQRQKYREGQLGAEQCRLLEELGMIWEPEESWEEKFEAARAYYEAHGNLDIPAAYRTKEGLALGAWYRGVRNQYRAGKLPAERIRRLEAIGMQWEGAAERAWMQNYEAAEAYYREHGDLDVPLSYETPGGLKLGVWISGQRYSYRKKSLGAGQAALLEGIGMIWERAASQWETGYAYAKAYAKEHGTFNPAACYVTAEGFALGAWAAKQRRKYSSGKLRAEQAVRLEELGMLWSPMDEQWRRSYEEACRYVKSHGSLDMPGSYETEDGFKLGAWLKNQRMRRRSGRMPEERERLLEAIGF